MNQVYTMLIWESYPEETFLYLIPEEAVTEFQRRMLRDAHGHWLNTVGCPEAPRHVWNFITEEDHVEDAGTPPDLIGSWAQFMVTSSDPLEQTHIAHVYSSGIAL